MSTHPVVRGVLATLLVASVGVAAPAAAATELPRPHQRFATPAAAAHWQVARLVATTDEARGAEQPWNGAVATCDAGTRSDAELDPVVELVNLHREVVGVPALVGTDEESNRLAQEASLLQEANQPDGGYVLDHTPPESWECWSQDGHDGSSTSNLHIGSSLWGQVFGYMIDDGDNNLAVGHRQWLLDPTMARVGVGGTDRAGAIRVIGVPRRPDAAARVVPWPAAGPSPAFLVPARWSLSFRGLDVDLAGADVTVTSDGSRVPVTVHGDTTGYGGYRTITWEMPLEEILAAGTPGPATTTFRVTVDDVVVDGTPTDYTYRVEVVPDRFADDDGGTFEADAIVLASDGVTRGCDARGRRFCPDDTLTRGQLAAMLARALELPASSTDWFTDDDTSIFEDDINRLREAGITRGCTADERRFCPDRPISRAEIATFFDRAFDLGPTSRDWFADDGDSVHEDAINRFRAAEITLGCNPPVNDRFCPGDDVTRGQIAAFFVRSALVTLPG